MAMSTRRTLPPSVDLQAEAPIFPAHRLPSLTTQIPDPYRNFKPYNPTKAANDLKPSPPDRRRSSGSDNYLSSDGSNDSRSRAGRSARGVKRSTAVRYDNGPSASYNGGGEAMSTDLRLPPIRTCLEHYASDIPTPGRPGASDHSMNRQEHHGQLPDRRPYDHQGFERSRQPRLPPINIGRPSAESSRPASSISSVHERSIGPPLRSPVTLTTPSQEGFTSLNSSALPSPATSGFPISYPSSTHSTHSTISHHNTGPGPWSSDPSPQYTWKAPTASGSSPNARKRRGNLPKESTSILNAWFYQHIAYPYPKEEEKLQLQALTGLSISQISNWFINARRRRRPEVADAG